MNPEFLDYLILGLFLLCLLYIVVRSLLSNQSTEKYFTAGRQLHWINIGMSLIAADLSIGYIIGSAGTGFETGLAVGSYGWTASVVIILVALYILPKFMRVGIVTLPEYLELRYNPYIRLVVAIIMILVASISNLSQMFYSSALLMEQVFMLDKSYFIYLIWGAGILSAGIILSGGLSVIFRTDMLLATAALVGGILVVIFSFIKIGGFENFINLSAGKVTSILPADDGFLPWTQVFFGGLWLLHLNYWAFNQPIMQKVLVADSLSQAQKGMLLAASIKLFLPFIFVIPGIIGFELFGDSISTSDQVFPVLLKEVVPVGLQGFIIIAFVASIFGVTNAVMHASAFIFTHDIYKRFIRKNATEKQQLMVYRIGIILTMIIACIVAPEIGGFKHIFSFSLIIRSVIAPAMICIFLWGMFNYYVSTAAAAAALILTIPNYFLIKLFLPQISNPNDFLGINFIAICLVMLILRFLFPESKPVMLKGERNIRFERNLTVMVWSIFIVTAIIAIYVTLI